MAIEDQHAETMERINAILSIVKAPSETLDNIKSLMWEYGVVYNDPHTSVIDCKNILDELDYIVKTLKVANNISDDHFSQYVKTFSENHSITHVT